METDELKLRHETRLKLWDRAGMFPVLRPETKHLHDLLNAGQEANEDIALLFTEIAGLSVEIAKLNEYIDVLHRQREDFVAEMHRRMDDLAKDLENRT